MDHASAATDVAAAIADMEFARQTHLDWAEHAEAHATSGVPCPQCQARGYPVDPIYEREWVRKYDRVIALLRSL